MSHVAILVEFKVCAKCKKEKPAEAFFRYKRSATGLGSYCKECMKSYRVAWDDQNQPKRARYRRSAAYKYSYGITVEQYESLLEAQNGVCAICEEAPTGRRLDTDHCHETERVRGLLCSSCNLAIGKLKHDTEIIRRAAEYLDE